MIASVRRLDDGRQARAGLLGVASLRDVEDEALHPARRALVVADENRLVEHPDGTSVCGDVAILGAQRLAGGAQVVGLGEHALEVVRVHGLREEVGVLHPLLGRVPEQLLHLRADVEVADGLVDRADVRDERQVLHERPVAQLGLAHRGLGAAALGELLLGRGVEASALEREGGEVGEAREQGDVGGIEAAAGLSVGDPEHADDLCPRAEGHAGDAVDGHAVVDGLPAFPPLVVLDRERLARLPDAAGEAFALLEAVAHVAREDAGADGHSELVAVTQVDVGVGRADELACLARDALEDLLGVELVDERERRLVQRCQLGVPVLDLVPCGHLRRHVDHEPLRVDRPAGLVLGDRDLVVDPDLALVLADDAVLRRVGLAGAGRAAPLFERAVAVVWVQHLHEESRVAHALESGVAGQLLDLRAHVDVRARLVEAGDVHDERQLLDQAAVVALGLGETDLGPAPLVQGLRQRRRVLLEPPVAVVERPGDLAEDGEERGVKEGEGERQRDGDRRDRVADVGGDRVVGDVRLEDACRFLALAEVDGDVRLDRLHVLAAPALGVQGRDVLVRLAGERLLERGSGVAAAADDLRVGRIGDHAVVVDELEAQERPDELGVDGGVELLAALGRDRAREVLRGQARRDPLGDLARANLDLVLRAILRLTADDPEDDDPGKRQRNRAVHGKAQDETRRSRRRRGRGGHEILIGAAKPLLECPSWTDLLGICGC